MLIKTNKQLSRRTFLKGMSTTIALPFLEAMLPSYAIGAEIPKRFLGYYVPCGINMANWTPKNTGTLGDLPKILQPMASLKQHINIISGLDNKPAREPGGDHAAGTSAFMSGRGIKKSQTDIQNGITVDQMIANQIGQNTPFPSLQVGVPSNSICDGGYACAYSRSISWASRTQPLPKITDPHILFNRLFGAAPDNTDYQSSVLDYVKDSAKQLSKQLGHTDKQRVEEYLNGVRELEKRINSSASSCDNVLQPDAQQEGDLIETTIDQMNDLMVAALKCDQTRVISFMIADGLSGRNHDFIGASGGHHETSHHQNRQDKLTKLDTINTWEVQQFASLLQKMQDIEELDGTLLDNSLVYFSSELSDGDSHSHDDMPILLAGSSGGQFRTGQHQQFQAPVSNLFLTFLESFGIYENSFGEDGYAPLNLAT